MNNVRRTPSEHTNTPDSRNHFRLGKNHDVDLASKRWTVDEPEDLEVIRGWLNISKAFRFQLDSSSQLTQQQPQLFRANTKFIRNEGALMEGARSCQCQ